MLYRALRLLRTYHQFTQLELSKLLGISNSYLSEIEKGDKTPGIELLQKYAEVFKMPLSSILLFSERIEDNSNSTSSKKLKIIAAEKILRLLEWIEEHETIKNQA